MTLIVVLSAAAVVTAAWSAYRARREVRELSRDYLAVVRELSILRAMNVGVTLERGSLESAETVLEVHPVFSAPLENAIVLAELPRPRGVGKLTPGEGWSVGVYLGDRRIV